jgi:hypothetical protein
MCCMPAGGAKTLSGGAGDDVYVFGRGDGAGSVFRNGPEPGEDDGGDSSRLRDVTVGVDQGTAATSDRDVVRLRAGVAPGDVRIDADGNDLVVVITDTDDRLVFAGLARVARDAGEKYWLCGWHGVG